MYRHMNVYKIYNAAPTLNSEIDSEGEKKRNFFFLHYL